VSAAIVVDYLADRAEAFEPVVDWIHGHWLQGWGRSRLSTVQLLLSRLSRDRLPIALVARVGREAVGTLSLAEDEAPSGGSVPCLSGVYVAPAWRRRGVGTRLCARAAEEAARLARPRLGLYTVDAADFYARRGWRAVCNTQVDDGCGLAAVVYMELTLPCPPPGTPGPAVHRARDNCLPCHGGMSALSPGEC
jgi:GNAT superfamily N-acetyltransferase